MAVSDFAYRCTLSSSISRSVDVDHRLFPRSDAMMMMMMMIAGA